MTDPVHPQLPPPSGVPPPAAPPPMPAAPSAYGIPSGYAPAPGAAWVVPQAGGKNRLVAILLALFLGWIGIHKFYLGKVALGVLYLVFFWTYIPALIAWIEAISYLLTSDESWARKYGGTVERSNGAFVGCLWLLALGPLIWVAIIALIFLGSQVSAVTRPA